MQSIGEISHLYAIALLNRVLGGQKRVILPVYATGCITFKLGIYPVERANHFSRIVGNDRQNNSSLSPKNRRQTRGNSPKVGGNRSNTGSRCEAKADGGIKDESS